MHTTLEYILVGYMMSSRSWYYSRVASTTCTPSRMHNTSSYSIESKCASYY